MIAVLAAITVLATTASGCIQQPAIDFDVAAIHRPPSVRTDFDLKQLTAMAAATHRRGKHDPLGFYLGTFGYTIDVQFDRDEERCVREVAIRMAFSLIDRRIEIARDLREHPCLYKAALAHYMRHANADDRVFSQYVRRVEQALRTTPNEEILDSPSTDGLDESRVKAAVTRITEEVLAPFSAARDAAPDAVDTPLEVERLSSACRGQP